MIKKAIFFLFLFFLTMSVVFASEDITTNLVLQWNFDTFPLIDSVGTNNPTLYNTAILNNDTKFTGNSSVYFTGDDTPAGMVRGSLLSYSSGTANVWAKFNGTVLNTTKGYTIFGGGKSDNINPQVQVSLDVKNTSMCYIRNNIADSGTVLTVTTDEFNCTNGEWFMVTWSDATNIGGTRDFYINGIKQNKTYSVGNEAFNSRFYAYPNVNRNGIGAYVRGGTERYSFHGFLDRFSVWNTPLTQNQISFLYSYETNLSFDFLNFNPGYYVKENKTLPIYLKDTITADCNFSVNSVIKETLTGIGNGTHFFNYTLDMGIFGINNLSVSCADLVQNKTINTTIYMDNVVPLVNDVNYTHTDTNSYALNNSVFSTQRTIPVKIYTNDTGDGYGLNVTFYKPSGSVFYSDVIENIEGNYVYNVTLNMSGESPGVYLLNVTVEDNAQNNYVSVNSFNYSYARVNVGVFAIIDTQTNELLTGTNLTVQYIGTEYQEQKTTTNGYAYFNVTFDSATDQATINVFQTTGNDYTIVTKQATIYNGQDNNITIYIANTSLNTKLVTFKVIDENKMNLPGAILRILKRNPADNTYLPVSDITVNPSGEANIRLVLDVEFYKFIVEYEGVNVYISGFPISINSNTDLITLECLVDDPYSEYFSYFMGLYPVLSFYKVNNETAYYELVYTSDNAVNICLKTHYTQNDVRTNYSVTCETGKTYGTIVSPFLIVNRYTHYHAEVWVDFVSDDEEDKKYIETVNSIGYEFKTGERGRLVVYFGLILISALGFIYNPTIGIITFIAGVVILALTNFTLIGVGVSMFIVGLSLFVLITLNRKKVFER